MKNCPNCQTQLADDTKFCPSCGQTVAAAPAPQAVPSAGKMHCPNCKSHNIHISTETSVDGAVTTSAGRLSSTHVSNTHRNYWFCQNCGTKFRSLPSLDEELTKLKKPPVALWVLFGIFVAAFLFFLFLTLRGVLSDSMFSGFVFLYTGPFMFGALAGIIIVPCIVGHYKKKAKKLEQEKLYLQQNCFD